eukprot:3213244-Alexandrium_andersonii.AAC.1
MQPALRAVSSTFGNMRFQGRGRAWHSGLVCRGSSSLLPCSPLAEARLVCKGVSGPEADLKLG